MGSHDHATAGDDVDIGPDRPSERLSDVFRNVARRFDKPGGVESLHQRAVIRLHRLARGRDTRGEELTLATSRPTTRGGLACTVMQGLRDDAVLLTAEYEVDDGGRGHQQHGDLLFWEAANDGGRLVVVECKRVAGGVWVSTHAAQRTTAVALQALRIAKRVRSWLAHLCEHDESLSRCVALCDGARCVAAATLTDRGFCFVCETTIDSHGF